MSDEYTPTDGQVREEWVAYMTTEDGLWGGVSEEEALAQWGRWLAARDREVAAKAWDEGARHVYTEGGKCSFARDGDPCPYNPYREGSR